MKYKDLKKGTWIMQSLGDEMFNVVKKEWQLTRNGDRKYLVGERDIKYRRPQKRRKVAKRAINSRYATAIKVIREYNIWRKSNAIIGGIEAYCYQRLHSAKTPNDA
jgi:hypothetical protein